MEKQDQKMWVGNMIHMFENSKGTCVDEADEEDRKKLIKYLVGGGGQRVFMIAFWICEEEKKRNRGMWEKSKNISL